MIMLCFGFGYIVIISNIVFLSAEIPSLLLIPRSIRDDLRGLVR